MVKSLGNQARLHSRSHYTHIYFSIFFYHLTNKKIKNKKNNNWSGCLCFFLDCHQRIIAYHTKKQRTVPHITQHNIHNTCFGLVSLVCTFVYVYVFDLISTPSFSIPNCIFSSFNFFFIFIYAFFFPLP